jgi:glutathione S-transferase
VIKLYFAPRTRAVRVRWTLEELGLPYQLERVTFKPTTEQFFIQDTPTGKLPTLVDGDVVMAESGAIVQYILGRYGAGRLAPGMDSADWPGFLQWLHYAESTAFPPLGILVWLTLYRSDATQHPALVDDARQRIATTLRQVESALSGKSYLVGETFSAADIMMGFTLVAAAALGQLGAEFPSLRAYVERLQARPALQRAAQ